MLEKELPDTDDYHIPNRCRDDDIDDEFCSEYYDLYQSIEDKDLIDPEDDDFEDHELDF